MGFYNRITPLALCLSRRLVVLSATPEASRLISVLAAPLARTMAW
jgi:hypothetical protein